MIETFALAPDDSKLIVTPRIENSRVQELLTLRRAYDRALMDIYSKDGMREIY